jgi:hypothetical protein
MGNTRGIWFGLLAAVCAQAAAETFSTGNFAARLEVSAVSARTAYGATKAPAGTQFLVLATQWENRVDPKLAEQRGLPPGYGVDNLPQHLYLVVDGCVLGVLRPGLDGGHGRSSLERVILAHPGEKLSGDIVFEIPAGDPASLDLRFYDDVAGDMKLALKGPAPAPAPLAPPRKNAVGEFALFDFKDPAPGVRAPAGFRAVAVVLRGRSVWLATKDAPAYNPGIEPGATVPRVNLLDWPEVRTYVHVLADGVYACPLAADQDLPEPLRFIPEFFTGPRLVFLVPADAKSLEFFGAMPHAATDDGTLDLAPLRFPLEGQAPAVAPFPGPLKIKDDMFNLAIGARRSAQFAGEAAGEGKVFVLLDVGVTNEGTTGEFFQPADQLPLLDADGNEIAPDDATSRGPHRPEGDKVHLPAGERRRFEVAYRMDASFERVRLSFHGGSFTQTYELVTPAPAAAPAPVAR